MTGAERTARERTLARADEALVKADALLDRAALSSDTREKTVLANAAWGWGSEHERLMRLAETGALDRLDGIHHLAELAEVLAPSLSRESLAAALRAESRARVRPPLPSAVIDQVVDRARAELGLRGAA
ncbi:MAG: hypothetical protein WEF50_11200 [Myxococcota bacterium]